MLAEQTPRCEEPPRDTAGKGDDGMPLYSYLCPDRGPFNEMRSMAVCLDPQPCHVAAFPPPRELVAPNIKSSERSAGDPALSGAAGSERHRDGWGCRVSGARWPFQAEAVSPRNARKARDKSVPGTVSFPT
jgi:hypothetical protein